MLSIRLQQVLKYISSDDYVADIGCDHGYLTIAAIEKGVKFVQLIDNKEGPLKVAKKNLQQFEDIAQVIYTHADGLSNLNHLINVACICGMGGDLIYHIIENSLAKAQNLDFLILQANSKVEFLRENLANLKFEIMDLIKVAEQAFAAENPVEHPSFNTGDTVSVHYKIVEGNKERIQVFRGVVIQVKGTGSTKTFTVRKMSGNVGVERIFPIESPFIKEIEVNKVGKVRRARIYYFRNLTGKKAKIKEKRS